MGLTNDKMFKHKSTGGLRMPWHKKKYYQVARPASNTRLIIEKQTQDVKHTETSRVKHIRCRGGNHKYRALRLSQGLFSWAGINSAHKAKILSVCYNSSSTELVRTNTLVKSCIVYVEAQPFADYEKNSKDSKGQKKIVDPQVVNQLQHGKLLAKITSRPGQSGVANGYILEGPELAFYMKKIEAKK